MLHVFDRPDVPGISPEQARDKQRTGAIVVDVRELTEWKEGHIAGALHIPLNALLLRLSQLDRDKEMVIVCERGIRSMTASRLLQSAGYRKVNNLSGGMILWRQTGLPIEFVSVACDI